MSPPPFDLRLTSPCPKSWHDLEGDERVRHCTACGHDVFHLSALDRAEGEALLAEAGGRVCLAFQRHPDGRIATADDPLPGHARPARRRPRLLPSLAGVFAGLLAACAHGDRAPAAEAPAVAPNEPDRASDASENAPALSMLGACCMVDVAPDEPSDSSKQ
jgi:hypothetical protein